VQESGVPGRPADRQAPAGNAQDEAPAAPPVAPSVASAYKKPEAKLPFQGNMNILNYYSLFKDTAKTLKIPEQGQLVLLELGLNTQTADTFRSVKASLNADADSNMEVLVRGTAELMGVGSRIVSIQEMHTLVQGPNEEAWIFLNRFEQVLLRYRLFNPVCEDEVRFWFLSKLRDAEEIELKLGEKPFTLSDIVKTANKSQKKKKPADGKDRSGNQGTPKKDGGRGAVVCHHCHKKGHKAKDCRQRIAEEKKKDQRNRSQQEEVISNTGYASTKGTVGGIPTEILLDSCAGTSVISREMADKLDSKNFTRVKVWRTFLWGTTRVECTEALVLDIATDGSGERELQQFTLYVVDGEVFGGDVLLSRDDCRKLGWEMQPIRNRAQQELEGEGEPLSSSQAPGGSWYKQDALQDGESEFLGEEPRELFGDFKCAEGFEGEANAMPIAKTFLDLAEPSTIPEQSLKFSSDLPEEISPAYRPKIAPEALEALRRTIEELKAAKIYVPCSGTYGSPWLSVKKPKGGFRQTIDCRRVNKYMLATQFAVKSAEEVFLNMKGFKVWSELDYKASFWQIRIDEFSGEVCAAVGPDELLRPTRLPQGARDSSTILEKVLVEYVIQPIKMKFSKEFWNQNSIVLFRDNLYLGSFEHGDHHRLLMEVAHRCTELNLKFGSYNIGLPEIPVLGFIVSEEGLSPLQKNMDKILATPEPKNRKEMMRFLGMCGYYRSLIKNYAAMVQPLELLLRKDESYVWGGDQKKAFDSLRNQFIERPMLGHIVFGSPIEISVDASGVAAGAMVVQGGKIVRIFSKKFNTSQSKYNTTRREALALLWAVQRFKHLMVGNTVVWTDHQPLERIGVGNSEIQDVLLQRWMDILQEFNIEIRYKRGSENGVADYLSRNASQQDFVPEKEILDYLISTDEKKDQVFRDSVQRKSRRYQVIDGNLYLKVGTNSYPVPDQESRLEWLKELHESLGHPTTSGMMQTLKDHWRWENMSVDIERINSSCLGCLYGGSEPAEVKSNWIQSRSNWRLFDEVSIDVITKLPLTKRGNNGAVVITEAISGWPVAYPIKTKMAADMGGCVVYFFTSYMVPRRIRSDRGGEFVNDVLKLLSEVYHFEHVLISSRHPQGDGQAERRIRDVANQIEKMDTEDWDLNLDSILMGIRVRPNARTGLSPYEILFCQSPRLPLDLKFKANLSELPTRTELADVVNMGRFISNRSDIHRDQWKKIKEKMKNYESSRYEQLSKFKTGELVMVRNKARKKGEPKWNGPYVVIKNHSKGVMVRLMNGKVMPYHEADIKKFKVPLVDPSGEESVSDGVGVDLDHPEIEEKQD
jgi:hypothetical protein